MQLISKLLNLLGLKILKRSTYESLELSKDTISTLLLINSKLSDRIRELDGFSKKNNIYKNIDLIMLSLSNFSEIDLYVFDSQKKVNFDTEYLVNKYGANIINFDSLDEVLKYGANSENKRCLVATSINSSLKELSKKEFDFIYIDEISNKSLSYIRKELGVYTLINDYDIGFGKLFQKKLTN